MTDKIQEEIKEQYGEKLRVRVCGVCIEKGKILLVHHRSLGKTNSLWAPPGGGMQFGEDARTALKREFLEETHCEVEVQDFLFVHEYLDPPLHGIELFFQVKIISGHPVLGKDPEMSSDSQLLTEIGFFDLATAQKRDLVSLHYVLQNIKTLTDLINQKGYFKFH